MKRYCEMYVHLYESTADCEDRVELVYVAMSLEGIKAQHKENPLVSDLYPGPVLKVRVDMSDIWCLALVQGLVHWLYLDEIPENIAMQVTEIDRTLVV